MLLPEDLITDDKTDAIDAEDPKMSALEDIVGRTDFDDLSDDEIIELLKQYGISEEDLEELLEDMDAVKSADSVADDNNNIDPLNIDAVDSLLDANTKQAQQMANEDNTEVKVTEEDKDDDGDPDKVTIKKEDPEEDGLPLDFEDEDVHSEKEDDPHDTNVLSDSTQKNIIGALSSFRW